MKRNDAAKIVPLGVEPPPEEPVVVTRPSRLHAWGTNGMTLFAFVGILATIVFISIRWPDNTGRYVIATLIFSIVGFLFCASMAVSAAMRDSYARPPKNTRDKAAADEPPTRDDQ